MTSRFRLRYILPAATVALAAGLALSAFTSDGSVLGYTRFNHLTDEKDSAVSYQQVSPDATATGTQSETSAPVDATMISPDDAVGIAQTVASGYADSFDIERRDDRTAYDIEIGETDVLVNALDGSIIRVETDDRDDEDDWDDRGDQQAAAPAVTIGEAIRAAEEVTSGSFDELELEFERGLLVYSIEIGGDEVIVDANDGAVLSVHADD